MIDAEQQSALRLFVALNTVVSSFCENTSAFVAQHDPMLQQAQEIAALRQVRHFFPHTTRL